MGETTDVSPCDLRSPLSRLGQADLRDSQRQIPVDVEERNHHRPAAVTQDGLSHATRHLGNASRRATYVTLLHHSLLDGLLAVLPILLREATLAVRPEVLRPLACRHGRLLRHAHSPSSIASHFAGSM